MPRPRFSLRSLVLLVFLSGAGVGIGQRWEPWVIIRAPAKKLQINADRRTPAGFGHYNSSCLVELDSEGTEVLRIELPKAIRHHDVSADNRRIAATVDGGTLLIYERQSGELLHEIRDCGSQSCIFSDDGASILIDYLAESDEHVFAQRRRPEYWWGVAWLPEFWLVAFCAIALTWSLRRDQRNLKPPALSDQPLK